jgi:hypothetical protein
MKNVTVKTNQGLRKNGTWNEKYYSAKQTGKMDVTGCVRIYVNGDEIHCKKEDIVIVEDNSVVAHNDVNGICPHCGTRCYGDCGRG